MRKNYRKPAWILTVALLLNLLLPGLAFAVELEEAPTFEVGISQGKPGDTVTVPIYVKNNPGIASIKLSVTYDKDELKLMNADVSMPQGTVTNSPTVDAHPYILNWVGGTYVHTEKDFQFATLTFLILEGASSKYTEISVSYDPDDVFDGDEENITFSIKNGGITIPHTSVTATVDAPVKGETLDTSVDVGNPSAYTGTVEWYEGDSVVGTAVTGGIAKANQVYTAKITLTVDEGEVFDLSLDGTSTEGGYQITRVSDTELTLTKTFPATLAKELQTLEVTTQPGSTIYTHGDRFNSTDMVVEATYDDGTTDENFTGYTVEYTTVGKGYLKKGDTKVILKAGNQSVEVNGLTVIAKDLTVSGLTAIDRTYDGTTNVTLSGGTLSGIVSGETVSAVMPTTGTIADASVGSGKAVSISKITLTGEDAGNYTLTQPTVTVNISTKPLSNSMITLGTQTIYTGDEQDVVIISVKDGSYNLTKGTDYAIVGGDKATNVGNTTLTITGIGNYSGTAIATWTLQKATPVVGDFSITTPTNGGVSYTGNPISVAVPTTDKNGMGAITMKYDNSTTVPINVGSYNVTFDVTEGTNYKAAVGLIIGTLQINKAEYTKTKTTDVTVRSNQEATNKKLTLPALPAGASYGTVSVITSNGLLNGTPTVFGTELTYSIRSKLAGTTEKVTVAVTGATNYNDYSVEITFTAKDKDDAGVTVTPANVTVKYGETVTIAASKIHNGTGMWSWTYPTDFFEAVGATDTSSITLKVIKADANAKTVSVKFENDTHIGTDSASITVNKAVSTVSIAPAGKMGLAYTGSAQELVDAGTAIGGELQYSVDNGAYSTAIPTGIDAKTYIVKYRVVGDANHEDFAEQTFPVTIAKADPDIGTVSKTGSDIIYPNTAPNTIKLTKTGTTEGMLLLDADQTFLVGTKDYNWTFTPTDSNNYRSTTGTVSLTVTEDKLASIAVKISPTKTTYKWGEEFIIAGTVIEATYSSGAKKDIAADELTYSKALSVGQVKVTVSYTESGVTKACDITGLIVNKADAKTLVNVPVSLTIGVTDEQTVNLGTVGMPADAGTLTYSKGTETKTGSVTVTEWSVDSGTGVVKYTLLDGAAGDTVTLPVKINSVNYAESTINVVITLINKDVPIISGIGGGSSSITTTIKNPDGSTTTKTENKATGTVTETTENIDGSIITVETQKDGTITTTEIDKVGNKIETVKKPDGSSITKVEQKDGTTATMVTDASGKTEVEVKLSTKTVNEAQETGGMVTLPIPEVKVSKSTDTASVMTISTGSKDAVKVEIPTANVTPGTVVVIVKADGTEEVVKTSVPTENGVVVFLSDGVTVKVVDNSKSFVDVPANHWAANAVSFCSARELFLGTAKDTFNPNSPMTRAMMMTVLARFDGKDTSGSDTWYQKGMGWAVANGISDGSNPSGNITREQLAVMLWRYAGEPATIDRELHFNDANKASGYALDALYWAVGNGIINGKGNGILDPGSPATRAEVAQMLKNYLNATLS